MSTTRVQLVLAALSLFAWGCAAASLDVPPESAANPKAHSMPVLNEAPALRDDYDPWQHSRDDAGGIHGPQKGHDMHDMHEGHDMPGERGEHAPARPGEPAARPATPAPNPPAHGGHEHE